MIKGTATLKITHETLRVALEQYFTRETFREGSAPRVASIEPDTGYSSSPHLRSFTVTLEDPLAAASDVEGGAS